VPTILDRMPNRNQLAVCLAFLFCGLDAGLPKAAYDSEAAYRIIQDLRHKDPAAARAKAHSAYDAVKQNPQPTVAERRLRLLYADILIEQGKASEAGPLLAFDSQDPEIAARLLAAKAYWQNKQNPPKYELARTLNESALAASRSIKMKDDCWTAEVLVHYSQILVNLDDKLAEEQLRRAEPEVNLCSDRFWTASLYLVKGNFYLDHQRYRQELDAASMASNLANDNKFVRLIPLANGNVALAYAYLGDLDNAQARLSHAESWYSSENKELAIDIGHRARVHHLRNEDSAAIKDYNKALKMLDKSDSWYLRNLEELTALLIESGQLGDAKAYDQTALNTANRKTDSVIVYSAQLNEIAITRLQHDLPSALAQGRSLARSFKLEGENDPELNWRLHSELAQTLDAMGGRQREADREFKIAVDTADRVRQSIDDDWSRMTFSVYLQRLVALYIDSRVKRKDDAGSLQLAETFRAQRLAEKLHRATPPLPEQFRKIAAARHAVILSYWINGSRSYLWATTAKEIRVFRLQNLEKLTDDIALQNQQIGDERDLRERPEFSSKLYKELVEPAESMIPSGANVIIVPDGPLGDLNFETLIPPATPAAYWLNRVSVTVAPSLALLQSENNLPAGLRRAFLAGDPIQKDRNPQLGEVKDIEPLFPDPVVLTGASATPKRFIDMKPGEFSLLHISAHAFANKESPLDSYVELTDGNLYAHDLKGITLKEDLVTLSACQGAAGRSLPGEGVVGLTWAILSAGARNVIASSRNVPVNTTKNFMRDFYGKLKAGADPAQALHDTKVALAHNQPAPYYWAGFQLYTR
jgi:CHAT domain-containing protein